MTGHAEQVLAPAVAAVAPRTAFGGPVPDFAPMRGIVTHERTAELAPELIALLTRLLGRAHLTARHEWPALELTLGDTDTYDDSVMWMRDYMPLYVRDSRGALSAWYALSDNENRARYRSRHDRLSDGRGQQLPLILEQGNVVTTGTKLFATEQLLSENHELLDDDHLLESGYRRRNEREIRRLLARATQRQTNDVVLLPPMPYEATGHVDMFLLPLDDDTVVVPAMENEALAMSPPGRSRHVGKVIQVFLDEQADYLSSLGLEVLRLPMVPPATTTDIDEQSHEEQEVELVVFTPANSLLLNIAGKRRVIVPSFDNVAADPKVRALFARYTASWMNTFRQRGWEAHSADASGLVSYLGLFRCVSAPVPLAD